jgi:fumarate hydratase subunit beta
MGKRRSMDDARRLTTPLSEETIRTLRAGERVLLSGVIYTARDAAHARLVRELSSTAGNRGSICDLFHGQVVYYVGPTPARPGHPIGAAGPTTSGRMDIWAPPLIAECGLLGMIGKGARNAVVRDACQRYGAVYFGAVGGLGALYGVQVKTAEVVAWPELGTEAVHRLVVRDLPLLVVNDTVGGDAYEMGREQYAKIVCAGEL